MYTSPPLPAPHLGAAPQPAQGAHVAVAVHLRLLLTQAIPCSRLRRDTPGADDNGNHYRTLLCIKGPCEGGGGGQTMVQEHCANKGAHPTPGRQRQHMTGQGHTWRLLHMLHMLQAPGFAHMVTL
jgi:hypothetical protein